MKASPEDTQVLEGLGCRRSMIRGNDSGIFPTKLASGIASHPFLSGINIRHRLILCFVFVIVLMLVGDGILLWQSRLIRAQVERLNAVDEELIEVQRVHSGLLSVYERLGVLARSEDSARLLKESGELRSGLLDDAQRTKAVFNRLPPEMVDQTVLPTLQSIERTLPSHLDAIVAAASAGEWAAVRFRIERQVQPLESLSSKLVRDVAREVEQQRAQAAINIAVAERRMLLAVPITAILTLLCAAGLGVAVTKSITEPLGRLVEGAKALARGEFRHIVRVSGQDEFTQLSNVFNETTEKLSTLYEALKESEDRLRDVIETIPTMAWTALPDGAIDFANQRWLEYTGVALEETSRWGWKLSLHPADIASHAETWQISLTSGQPFENEARLRRASDGEYRWFLHRAVPLRGVYGNIVKWYGTATDIEDRKLAEQTLRQSEVYLAEAQRLSHSGSWAWRVGSNRTYLSREAFRIYDIDRDSVPTKETLLQLAHPDDRAGVEAVYESLLYGRQSDYSYRIVLPSGSTKYVRSVAHPVVDEGGHVVEVVGTIMDITEQHNAQEALESAFEEINLLKDQLFKENIALREEVDKTSMFEEIVGNSGALRTILTRVAKVAPTNSTILLTGETGTGKELVARAIHKRSQRASRAFVNVNCAAIPTPLMASELFGHEKGAFTGAQQRRLGRFEIADGGTIFLDEVGELPMEAQTSLLRVLQEREFERVGGNRSIPVDVRVIAATNRDLPAAIAAGIFRSDLFYRLNVVPMEIPPLRRRKEDIPVLIEYFVDRFVRRLGKNIRSVEKRTLELLQSYSWPGNIRELQNVIERSVVICETDVLSVEEGWLAIAPDSSQQEAPDRLSLRHSPDQERKIIEDALAQTHGRISGPYGAATQLGMPASTLEHKIRILRIDKYRFKRV